jgi:hypothetical protein
MRLAAGGQAVGVVEPPSRLMNSLRLMKLPRVRGALTVRSGSLGIKVSSRELSAPWCARCSISLLDVLKSYALEDIAAREFPA